MKYRNSFTIMGQVLTIASEAGNGVNHTSLLRRANLSHSNLCKTIGKLMSAELLDEKLEEGQRIYFITSKGNDYLNRYEQFAQISDSFGLKL